MKSVTHLMLLALALLLFNVQAQRRQPVEQARRVALTENRLKAGCSFSIDRSEYFPGEAILAKVHIRNPLATDLEILDPVASDKRGRFTLFGLRAPGFWEPLYAGSDRPQIDVEWPTINLRSGQTVERDVYSHLDRERVHAWPHAAPNHTGQYRLRLDDCGTEMALFEVVSPRLALSTDASVREYELYVVEAKKILKGTLRMAVFVLEYKNRYYICASLIPGPGGMIASRDGGPDPTSVRGISPYIRVESSPKAIAKLSATSDADGNLTIVYTDVDGKTKTVDSPKNRKPLTVQQEEEQLR